MITAYVSVDPQETVGLPYNEAFIGTTAHFNEQVGIGHVFLCSAMYERIKSTSILKNKEFTVINTSPNTTTISTYKRFLEVLPIVRATKKEIFILGGGRLIQLALRQRLIDRIIILHINKKIGAILPPEEKEGMFDLLKDKDFETKYTHHLSKQSPGTIEVRCRKN